jgi:hypothetical protein
MEKDIAAYLAHVGTVVLTFQTLTQMDWVEVVMIHHVAKYVSLAFVVSYQSHVQQAPPAQPVVQRKNVLVKN